MKKISLKTIYNKLFKEYATSSFNRLVGQKIRHSPKSDLNFWEICNQDNVYTITKQVKNDKKSRNKKNFSKRKSKK